MPHEPMHEVAVVLAQPMPLTERGGFLSAQIAVVLAATFAHIVVEPGDIQKLELWDFFNRLPYQTRLILIGKGI